jgi:superfamily I DNA and/or RNA helicase
MQIVEELYGQLMKLSAIASHEYSQMCSVVRAGILIRARVVLCTVATASGCGNDSFSVSDEFKPLFIKLSTIIIDEAGTAPESKLPLLLTLNPLGGVTRIIAIGDQQQLAPFSLIQGDHMGFFQRLDKALQGG